MHAQCHIPGQSRTRLEAQPSSPLFPGPLLLLPLCPRRLQCLHRESFVYLGHTALPHAGPQGQGSNQCCLQQKHRVVSTGAPEKFHFPRESCLLLCSIFPEAPIAESDPGKTTILDPQNFSILLVKYKMAQTLAIGLEKQNDQPTPSKALPKLSLSLSFSRGPHKVCGRGTVVPSRIITGGSPITGAPSLEGSPSRRTQKVHSDLLSSSLRSECPQPEPDPHGHRGGPGRQGKLASLSLDQSRLCTLSASICKGACHLYTWKSLARGRLL